jgi:hypothetical protein
MSNALWRRKIDHTARECAITGVLLMCGGDVQLVLAEGGMLQIMTEKRCRNNTCVIVRLF